MHDRRSFAFSLGAFSFLLTALLAVGCGGDDTATQREREAAPSADSAGSAAAPDVVILGEGSVSTTAREFGATLTPDGGTIYFNRASEDLQELTIMASDRRGSEWSEPRVASFSGTYRDVDAFVTPDGERIYFNSDRPADDPEAGGIIDTWFVERTDGGWGEPERLPAPLNSDSVEVFVSSTREGTLYFRSDRRGPRGIYRSSLRDGAWTEPERVSFGTVETASNPLVAPDGSFLVHTNPGPEGWSEDLWVSCATETGWGEPIRLPEPVNSRQADFAPGLDPTDGSLLFTSERPGIVGVQPDSMRPPGDIYESTLRPGELCP